MDNILPKFPIFQSSIYWEYKMHEPIDFSKLDNRYLNSELIKVLGSSELLEFWIINELDKTPLKDIENNITGSFYNRSGNSIKKLIGGIEFFKTPVLTFGKINNRFRNKNFGRNDQYFEIISNKVKFIYNIFGQLLYTMKDLDNFKYEEEYKYNDIGNIVFRRHHQTIFKYEYHFNGYGRTIRMYRNNELLRNSVEYLDYKGNIKSFDSPTDESRWEYDDNHNVIYETYLDKDEDDPIEKYFEYEYDEDQRLVWVENNEGSEVTITKTEYPISTDPNITNIRIETTIREFHGEEHSEYPRLVVRYETHRYNDFIKIVRKWGQLDGTQKTVVSFKLNLKEI